MVEVFKTNVNDKIQADLLLEKIHFHFNECSANFDLEDCDRILRVESLQEPLHTKHLIDLLQELGFYIEVLPDDIK